MSQHTGITIAQIGVSIAGAVLAPFTYGLSAVAAVAINYGLSQYEQSTLPDNVTKQESIADLRIQTSTLGLPIPQVFGRARVAGNVIWATEKVEHEHRTSESASGKGGGPENVTITKTYTISMAIALCDTRVSGEMTGLVRAWRNANLLYDVNQSLGINETLQWTFYPGAADQLPDPTMEAALGVGNVPGYRYTSYLVMKDEDLGRSGQTAQYSFEVRQADYTTNLVDVVVNLCHAASIADEELDVSLLPAESVQMSLVAIEAVRASLEQIALVYRFYGLESGMQYVFRPIGTGEVVASIPEDDLSAGENQATEQGLQVVRGTNLELPTILYLTYVDPAQNYQRNTQPSTVVLPPSGRENPKTVSVSLAIGAERAAQLANELVVLAWVQRETGQETLPRKYAYLEPGDKVEMSSRELTYPLLLRETTYGDPGIVEIQASVNASPRLGAIAPGESMPIDTYITGAQTSPPGIVTPPVQPVTEAGDTTPLLLNLPVLDSRDQAPRYHVAYVGENEPWEGGVLYRSVDGSVTFQQVDAGRLEAYTGTVAVALPSVADWTVLDTTTTFRVVLEYGTLTTINDAALAAGQQRGMVGDELIYIGHADLVSGRTYDCSRLWRGRQGTEWAVSTHGADETFVLIDAAVHTVGMSTAERGVSYDFKAVTLGQNISEADTVTFAGTAENLIPWQVLPPLASRPVQDWHIRWYMRSRFVPGGIDPDFVGFEVNIYSSASFATVVRTITTSGGYAMDPLALKGTNYTAAQQLADFGSVQNTLYYTIAQVGAYATGRSAHRTSTDTTTVQGAIEDTTSMPSMTWVEVTAASQAMSVATGYVANRATLVTLTLPTTAVLGDVVEVVGRGAGGWRIAQNASQQIRFGVMQSTTGTAGYIASGNRYDSVTLRCVEANAGWVVDAFQGTVTVH